MNFGDMISKHKTSWSWVFMVGILFYIPALFFILVGLSNFIYLIVAVILILLSIAFIRPFRGVIYDEGFLFATSFKATEVRFDEVESMYVEDGGLGGFVDDLDTPVLGYILIASIAFYSDNRLRRRIIIHKKDGSVIQLKKSREKNYSIFIDELENTFISRTSRQKSRLVASRQRRLRQRRNG